jgi:hypothetical protein
MKNVLALVAVLAAATAQAQEAGVLYAEAKRVEIIRERFNAAHDPRLNEVERQVSQLDRRDIDLAAADLLLMRRQLENGSAFLEDRRTNR